MGNILYKGFSKIHYKRHEVEFYNSLVFNLRYNSSFKITKSDNSEPIVLYGVLDPSKYKTLFCGWSSMISGKYRKLFK